MPLLQESAAIAPLVLSLVCCVFLARASPVGASGIASAALLLLAAVVWSQVQKVYEGPTVIAVTGTRGLTVADLVLVPAFAIVVAVLVRAWGDRRPS